MHTINQVFTSLHNKVICFACKDLGEVQRRKGATFDQVIRRQGFEEWLWFLLWREHSSCWWEMVSKREEVKHFKTWLFIYLAVSCGMRNLSSLTNPGPLHCPLSFNRQTASKVDYFKIQLWCWINAFGFAESSWCIILKYIFIPISKTSPGPRLL